RTRCRGPAGSVSARISRARLLMAIPDAFARETRLSGVGAEFARLRGNRFAAGGFGVSDRSAGGGRGAAHCGFPCAGDPAACSRLGRRTRLASGHAKTVPHSASGSLQPATSGVFYARSEETSAVVPVMVHVVVSTSVAPGEAADFR